MIEFIWFDLGYTLLYKKREEAYRAVLADFGVEASVSDIARAFHLADKKFMREFPGVLGWKMEFFMPWYLGIANYYLGVSVDLCALNAKWIRNRENADPLWYPYNHTEQVLHTLRAADYRLGVISNWDRSARPILAQNGLLRYFDACVISSEVGVSKPSPEIFKIAAERAGVEPVDSLYVGDNYYDDIVGASSVGMPGVVVNPFGRLGIEELPPDVPVIADITEIIAYLGRENA